MNWVDLVIILLLVFFTLEGYGRGLISETLDFVSFLVAFYLSLVFFGVGASFFMSQFQIPRSLANVLGFIAVWFLVESVLFSLIKLAFLKIPKMAKINLTYHHLGVIPAFFRGFVFVAILLLIVGTFPIQPRIKSAVEQSLIGAPILKKTQQAQTPLKNVFGGITQETLTFLTIKPKSDETVDLGFKTTEFQADSALEQEMIRLVNEERSKNNLNKLEFDPSLREVARPHSEDMFIRGYFSHYSPEGYSVADRASQKSVEYGVIGENLAYAPSLELAHTGLMNSPGHRANILSKDYNQIGIGIMKSSIYGLMITQVFSD